jgi:glucose-6-phosphate 1-dehydrogenase
VVFGRDRDLTPRKILPALYNLRRAGLLPPESTILAFARRPYGDDQFRTEMKDAVGRSRACRSRRRSGTTSPTASTTSR